MKRPAEIVREWLRFAEEDLSAAEVLLDEGLFNQSCFHSQLGAEKALKACLIAKKVPVPRIHDLNELIAKAIRAGTAVLIAQREGVGDLNLFYAPTRYPDAALGSLPDRMPNEEDAKGALETARHLLRTVVRELAG